MLGEVHARREELKSLIQAKVAALSFVNTGKTFDEEVKRKKQEKTNVDKAIKLLEKVASSSADGSAALERAQAEQKAVPDDVFGPELKELKKKEAQRKAAEKKKAAEEAAAEKDKKRKKDPEAFDRKEEEDEEKKAEKKAKAALAVANKVPSAKAEEAERKKIAAREAAREAKAEVSSTKAQEAVAELQAKLADAKARAKDPQAFDAKKRLAAKEAKAAEEAAKGHEDLGCEENEAKEEEDWKCSPIGVGDVYQAKDASKVIKIVALDDKTKLRYQAILVGGDGGTFPIRAADILKEYQLTDDM